MASRSAENGNSSKAANVNHDELNPKRPCGGYWHKEVGYHCQRRKDCHSQIRLKHMKRGGVGNRALLPDMDDYAPPTGHSRNPYSKRRPESESL